MRRRGLRQLPLSGGPGRAGGGRGGAGPWRTRQGHGHGLHRHLRGGAGDGGRARRRALHQPGPGARGPHRPPPPFGRRNRGGMHLLRSRSEAPHPAPEGHRVFPRAGAHCASQLRADGIRLAGGLHRPRRLRRPRGGADAKARRRGGGDQAQRPARARRRGLPHGRQVGGRHERGGGPEIHGLQRRRGRPRRLHGPLHSGGRPAQPHRGHAAGRLRHRRQPRLRLRARGVSAGRGAAEQCHSSGTRGGAVGRGHSGLGFRFRSGNPHRRGRVRLRRGNRADELRRGPARRARPEAALPV